MKNKQIFQLGIVSSAEDPSSPTETTQNRLRKSHGNHPFPAGKSDSVWFIPRASDPLEAACTNQTL